MKEVTSQLIVNSWLNIKAKYIVIGVSLMNNINNFIEFFNDIQTIIDIRDFIK